MGGSWFHVALKLSQAEFYLGKNPLPRADHPVQSFPPQLTDIQLQTLDLLGIPVNSFIG
jgi:hypothetical protein